VNLGGWLHTTEMVYPSKQELGPVTLCRTQLQLGWATLASNLLIATNSLPLSQTANQLPPMLTTFGLVFYPCLELIKICLGPKVESMELVQQVLY